MLYASSMRMLYAYAVCCRLNGSSRCQEMGRAATLFTHIPCKLVTYFSFEIGARFCGTNNYQFGPARSRKRRFERGPHHAKGTRYVGELFVAALLGALAAIQSVSLSHVILLRKSTQICKAPACTTRSPKRCQRCCWTEFIKKMCWTE